MNKKKSPEILNGITITDIADEGMAVGRHNNMVVFVKNAVPGDIVNVQLTRVKSHYREGIVHELVKASDNRVLPFCKHFGTCGGCKWQHLSYDKQLEFKQSQVTNQLKRIGGLELPEPEPVIGAEKTTYYRNKLEYTFSDRKWFEPDEPIYEQGDKAAYALGFHAPFLFDKVVDIKQCYLQADPGNNIRNFVRDYALSNDLTYYSIRRQTGLLRNLIIRNTLDGQFMVLLSIAENEPETAKKLLGALHKKFPEIKSLHFVINSTKNDTLATIEAVHVFGDKSIAETMGSLKFAIGPKSFFQTNSSQAFRLYQKILEYASPDPNDVIFDLYTGTGTIANFVAPHCSQVIGIESIAEAITDARTNAAINGISNAQFFTGDVKDVMNNDFLQQHKKPSIIIVDPPRAGLHPQVTETILGVLPQKIVYVSCNAATQARDLKMMQPYYKIDSLQAVDMFPHTQHIENLAKLSLR